ncbi:unnamed protein product [Prunus armeniaca]
MGWLPNPSGSFTVKSAYNIQVQGHPSYPQAHLVKKMWKLDIPHKVQIFVWMLIRKRLQVRARLHRFMPHLCPDCPLCQNQPETIQDLFVDCSFAKNVWECSFVFPSLPSQASNVISFVIRNSYGHVLLIGSINIGENSINVAKRVALRDSLAAAIDRGWGQILVEAYVHFQHVFRESNFTVDAIAKLGHWLSSQVYWELGLPLSICSRFYFDLFGHSCLRGFVL